jgi:Zn-dependent metalloprotease
LAEADHAKAADGSAALRYERERATLLILPQRDEQARLAWQVEFFTELQGPIAPCLWTYFIDAVDGAILDKRNNLDTLSQASGPGGNPKVMCDPRADGRSIDNLANYFDGLDVHFSSGIMNKAFCRAARRFATGNPLGNASVDSVRRAAKVFYEANDHYWTSSSSFVQGCAGTIDAAIALGYSAGDINALRAFWADVGVACRAGVICPAACRRVTLDVAWWVAIAATIASSPATLRQPPGPCRRTAATRRTGRTARAASTASRRRCAR